MKVIETIEELKTLASKDGGCDCYIRLNFGARSSKHVAYDKNTDEWSIYNEIDGSFVVCTTSKINEVSNILEALSKRVLVLEN